MRKIMSDATTNPKMGVFYKIKNKRSGLFLKIRGVNTTGNPWDPQRDDKKNGSKVKQTDYYGDKDQQFLFIPADADNKYFYIAIRHSGKGLQVASQKQTNGARIEQHTINDSAHRQWTIDVVKESYIHLIAKHSQKCMQVEDESKDDGALMEQGKPKDKGHKLYLLKEAENLELENFDDSQWAVSGASENYPSLESLDIPPECTEELLIGKMWVPYLSVNDPDLDREQQIKQSPYYKLFRYQCWVRCAYKYNDGENNSVQVSQAVSYGFSETDNTTLTNTLSISVNADLGFSFNGLSLGISSEMENSLSVSISHTEEWATESTYQVEAEVPPLTAFAAWKLRDIYRLYNMRDELVYEWAVDDATVTVDDFYSV